MLDGHARLAEDLCRVGEILVGGGDVSALQMRGAEVEPSGRVLHRIAVDGVAVEPFGKLLQRSFHLHAQPPYAGAVTALVACFGNALRGDDGFGMTVAEALLASPLPADVHVMDVGIGGIHLVQELMRGVDLLIVVDAVDLGMAAGVVVTQRPEVADLDELSGHRRRDELADMHLATPERALALARGLGALPAQTLLVGVQTTDTERLDQGLSARTAAAVPVAVAEVRRLLAEHAALQS